MTFARDTRAVIDLARLERNYFRLRGAHRRKRLMTVLKANAYGHGMIPAARFLQSLGQELFGVAVLEEAIALREAGISGRILVLGPPAAEGHYDYRAYRDQAIEMTVPSLHHLHRASRASPSPDISASSASSVPPLEIHLKLDTGMGRIGIQRQELQEALSILGGTPGLNLRGVFSHFAESERLDSGFCDSQLEAFNDWRKLLLEGGKEDRPEFHLSNSGGLLRGERFHFDYARVGFALWAPLAFSPASEQPPLNREIEPAMALRTRISHIKTMTEGATVGYSRTYRCREGEVIATLPVGYGDGYFRSLSNRGFVEIGGRRYPVAGNVSMDQTTVSLGVGSEEQERVGDEVLLLGEGLPAAEVAKWAGTIDYELFTHLGARIRREYVYDGTPMEIP